MKVSIEELRYKQSRPLSEKIEMSQCVIEQWYGHWNGQVYVSFSGGKDSTVLLDLVRKIFPEVPAVFADTGLEYPEIKEFVITFDNVVIIRPKLSFRQVIEKYGYPIISKEQARYLYEYHTSNSEKLKNIRLEGNKWGMGKVSKKWRFLINAPFKISHMCCYTLKKYPFREYEKRMGQKGYLGILAWDSRMRTETYLRYGCNAFETNRPISTPIAFWTEQDILHYIKNENLILPSIYGEIQKTDKLRLSGVQNTGCIFCAFGAHLQSPPNKFQLLKVSHPQLWKYCMEDLRMKEVLEYISVPYE